MSEQRMNEQDTSAHRVRIGILGTARIAGRALIEPARAVPSVSVAAIAARDADRAAAYAEANGIPAVFGSYDELLASSEIDAVYVPLPNALHAPWTLRALAAGKHVLCEKPFASNAREAVWVADAAERFGLVVMEAMHYRYHPLVQRLASLISDGAIGTPSHAQAWTSWAIRDPGDIRYDYALGGGALMDGGCYAIDCLRLVGSAAASVSPVADGPDGKPASEPVPTISGALADPLPDGLVDRAMAARLAFPTGMTGWFESAFTRDGEFRADVHVIGSEGHLWLRNFINAHQGRLVVTRNESVVSDESAADLRRYDEAGDTTFAWQLRAFAAAVLDGSPFPTTADSAVTTMRLIDDAYTAAGMPVRGKDASTGGAPPAPAADKTAADETAADETTADETTADETTAGLAAGAAVEKHPRDESGIVGHRDVPAAWQGGELRLRQPLPGDSCLAGRQHAIHVTPRYCHGHVRRHGQGKRDTLGEQREDRVAGGEEGEGVGEGLFRGHPRRPADKRAVDDAPAGRAAGQRGDERAAGPPGELPDREHRLGVAELPPAEPESRWRQHGHRGRAAARALDQRESSAQRVTADMRAVKPELAEERLELRDHGLDRRPPGGDQRG
jgi:predicted dehydrogenase